MAGRGLASPEGQSPEGQPPEGQPPEGQAPPVAAACRPRACVVELRVAVGSPRWPRSRWCRSPGETWRGSVGARARALGSTRRRRRAVGGPGHPGSLHASARDRRAAPLAPSPAGGRLPAAGAAEDTLPSSVLTCPTRGPPAAAQSFGFPARPGCWPLARRSPRSAPVSSRSWGVLGGTRVAGLADGRRVCFCCGLVPRTSRLRSVLSVSNARSP